MRKQLGNQHHLYHILWLWQQCGRHGWEANEDGYSSIKVPGDHVCFDKLRQTNLKEYLCLFSCTCSPCPFPCYSCVGTMFYQKNRTTNSYLIFWYYTWTWRSPWWFFSPFRNCYDRQEQKKRVDPDQTAPYPGLGLYCLLKHLSKYLG